MKFILMAILILLNCYTLFSQETVKENKDTISFELLPDVVKSSIREKISGLISKRILKGKIKYYDESHQSHNYTYEISYKDTLLNGYYTYSVSNCDFCMPSHGSKYFTTETLFCCKDPSHNPRETAKTEEEMRKIKKKNHCKKIGICIIE